MNSLNCSNIANELAYWNLESLERVPVKISERVEMKNLKFFGAKQ